MKKNFYSRRNFLQAGAKTAAGFISLSLFGCGGGSGDGGSPSSSQSVTFEGHLLKHTELNVTYQVANSTLYRQLLPSMFDLPGTLQLTLQIIDRYGVTSPLVPYLEGVVFISCLYKGQSGIYYLTVPVSEPIATEAGRKSGYPKYVADKIELAQANGAWNGKVVHQGRTIMQIGLTSLSAGVSQTITNFAIPAFNLLPIGVGPQVLMLTAAGQQTLTSSAGIATVSVDPGESWAGLLNGAAIVSAQHKVGAGDVYVTKTNL